MKSSPLALAALAGTVLAVSMLACSAAPEAPEAAVVTDESLGTAQQALCRVPPCVTPSPTATVADPDPTPDPTPPPQLRKPGPTFDCTGVVDTDEEGRQTGWVVRGGCISKPSAACTCQLRKNTCPPSVPNCSGSSLVSVYTCPKYYPVLYCNVYGACTCWSS